MATNEQVKELFPDGTPIDDWFYDIKISDLDDLGRKYDITEYGVKEDGKVYTQELQNLIDVIAEKGGKDPWADEAPNNGANERILVEDCRTAFVTAV